VEFTGAKDKYMDSQRTICIFTGAGFSKALFDQKLQHEFTDDLLTCETATAFLSDELKHLLQAIKDIELVMSHFHNLAYSDQRTHDPNWRRHKRDIIFLRTAIAVYFREKFCTLDLRYANEYKLLMKAFFDKNRIAKDNIFFVTTNYDLGTERVIIDLFGPDQYFYPGDCFPRRSSASSAVSIFKLHGSVNWLENRGRNSSNAFQRDRVPEGFRIHTNLLDELEVRPLPNRQEFSLQSSDGYKFTPILTPFFYQKHEWLKQNKGWERLFSTTWRLARDYLHSADEIFFWGYGMPSADHYIFTFLASIIASKKPKCYVVDLSDYAELNTTLAKMIRHLHQGREAYYREHKEGLIEYLRCSTSSTESSPGHSA